MQGDSEAAANAARKMTMSALHRVGGPPDAVRGAVIFVHGLGGDPTSTWSSGPEQSSFWPLWLSQSLPDISVFTLEYDAAPSNWVGSAMALPDRATNILNVLIAEQRDKYPIIFVCHSLGGLVVKQLIRIAADDLGSQFGRVLDQIQAVVFFATPNSGSDIAGWTDRLRVLFRPSAATNDLQPDSAYLRDLNYWYRDHAPREDIGSGV